MRKKYKVLSLHRTFSYTTILNRRFFLEEISTLSVALLISYNRKSMTDVISRALLLTVALGSSSLNFKVQLMS